MNFVHEIVKKFKRIATNLEHGLTEFIGEDIDLDCLCHQLYEYQEFIVEEIDSQFMNDMPWNTYEYSFIGKIVCSREQYVFGVLDVIIDFLECVDPKEHFEVEMNYFLIRSTRCLRCFNEMLITKISSPLR